MLYKDGEFLRVVPNSKNVGKFKIDLDCFSNHLILDAIFDDMVVIEANKSDNVINYVGYSPYFEINESIPQYVMFVYKICEYGTNKSISTIGDLIYTNYGESKLREDFNSLNFFAGKYGNIAVKWKQKI